MSCAHKDCAGKHVEEGGKGLKKELQEDNRHLWKIIAEEDEDKVFVYLILLTDL